MKNSTTWLTPSPSNLILKYPYAKARELLAVSEKYILVGLKAQCGDSLIKQISLETVADLAILADLYSLQGCQMSNSCVTAITINHFLMLKIHRL